MKKRILSLIAGAAIALTPLSSFALTPMSDAGMKDATGQAGVSIALDDITIYQSVGETVYEDTDGYYDIKAKNGCGGEPEGISASVVISDKESLKTFRAILDGTNRGDFLQRAYGADALLDNGDTFGDRGIQKGDIRPLSIDVAHRVEWLSKGMMFNATGIDAADQVKSVETATTNIANTAAAVYFNANGIDPATASEAQKTAAAEWAAEDSTTEDPNHPGEYLSNAEVNANAADLLVAGAYASTNVAGVVIGLPTIEIHTTSDSYTVGLRSEGSHNDGDNFIKIHKGESTMAVLSGTLEICPH